MSNSKVSSGVTIVAWRYRVQSSRLHVAVSRKGVITCGLGLRVNLGICDKKKKKKKTKSSNLDIDDVALSEDSITVDDALGSGSGVGEVYAIDAAKKIKYDDLFPVEAKKFWYDPNAKAKFVEESLDGRVKKKADHYCK
ncbi:hypothetical protein M9H77_22948 [Catharanthus roseus]|uniref:Uncharacterized protein n=1 Tax=Catharanthus roseus TaxID=4058 RepID=A0ACC0ARW0_CATRO|nr:hypothetical protein M9H77_22948 [Catharanthus roseus]